MSGWNPADWEVPMFVKVVAIASAVCTALVIVIGGIILGMTWINDTWGENVAAAVFIGCIGFAVVAFFTWMILEDW